MNAFRRIASAGIVLAALITISTCALADGAALTPEDYDPENPSTLLEGHLYAESALLIDMDTNEILLSKNSRVRMYPASTTKIMTLLLALESDIPLESEVVIPKEANNVPEGSSVIGIKSGDRMTWSDLLYGFMLRSGNDGSNAIAMLTAGSIDAFVERMNERAAQLQCEGTKYVNAHGYHDPEHYTTAQDLARISLYAMRNETFRQIVATGRKEITVTRGKKTVTNEVENRNSLVVPESDYYYAGANGIKTGHHGKAGRCVVASAERSGVNLLAVVMHCATEAQQFDDAKKLFDYGFSQYSAYSMEQLLNLMQAEICTVQLDNAALDDPDGGRLTLRLENIVGGDSTRMIQRNSQRAMSLALDDIRSTLNIHWNRDCVAPVTAGETLGTLTFTASDGTTVSADLAASRDVAAKPEDTPVPTEAAPQDSPAELRNRQNNDRRPPVGLIAALVLLGVCLTSAVALAVQAQKEKKRRARRRRRAQARKVSASGARHSNETRRSEAGIRRAGKK